MPVPEFVDFPQSRLNDRQIRRSQDGDPEFSNPPSQFQDDLVFGDKPVRPRVVRQREEGFVITIATARETGW